MTDIRAVFVADRMVSDYALTAGLLESDDGLETAVVLSLFTDARARPDDELPDAGDTDRRGWWGDIAPPLVDGRPVEGDRFGSRLWLLSREKQTQAVVARARQYLTEALAWMIEDGVCERIDTTVEIGAPGRLDFEIVIHRPRLDAITFKYGYAWSAQGERAS